VLGGERLGPPPIAGGHGDEAVAGGAGGADDGELGDAYGTEYADA
jgi:hypothetical protein